MTDVIRPTAPCPRWSRETPHGAHEWPAPVDGVSRCPGWPPPALPAMIDAETTRDMATRSRLGAAGRLQLDALAQYGGKGEVLPLGMARYRLSVPRSPHNAERWVELHNVHGATLHNLERLGLLRFTGDGHEPRSLAVELTDAGRRVAELAA